MTCEDWPIIWACEDPPAAEPHQMAAAANAAQSLLYSLSGSRFGTCSTTESYVTKGRHVCQPPRMDGSRCCSILLKRRPVRRIDAVTVDGEPLDASSYFLTSGRHLTRTNGCWPETTDCERPRLTVSYTYGIPLRGPEFTDDDPPVMIRPASTYWGAAGLAMGELIGEFIAGMCGNPCKLPSRVAAITRQGVTVTFTSPEQWMQMGLTGLPLTDAFVRSVNPTGRRMQSQVYSPDMARRV